MGQKYDKIRHKQVVLLERRVAFKRDFLWSLFCMMVCSTPGFSAITSKEYVDTHVKNQVSTLATKAELTSGLAGKQAAGNYALKSEIPTVPTKVSALTNDSGFITSSVLAGYAKTTDIPSVPSAVSELANDSGYITNSALSGYAKTADLPTVPTKVSAFTNDAGYATTNAMNTALSGKVDTGALTAYALKTDLPTKTSQLTNDSGFITSSALAGYAKTTDIPTVPTKTSQLANDSGFITAADVSVPTKTSQLTNDSGFITAADIPEFPESTDMSGYVSKTGTNEMGGNYTVTGSFKVPTPALPTE